MNKKSIWLVIPAVLLPYVSLFMLATVLFSGRSPFFLSVMRSCFQGKLLYLVTALLLYCLLAALLSIIAFTQSLSQAWDAPTLAKSALVIKLVQIPAYILVFILGAFLALSIFTLPFTIGLFLLDSLTLLLSGLNTAAAGINAVKAGILQPKEATWIILLQLVFCVDIFATASLWRKLKKARSE